MIRSSPLDTAARPADAGPSDARLSAAPGLADAVTAVPADRRVPLRSRAESHALAQPGRRRLAQALFAAGGALSTYPGPAAAIGAGDLVLAANEAAEPLLGALLDKLSGELRSALD